MGRRLAALASLHLESCGDRVFMGEMPSFNPVAGVLFQIPAELSAEALHAYAQGNLQSLMTCASYCHASAAAPVGYVRPAVSLIRCNTQVRAHHPQLNHLILSQPIQSTHSKGFFNRRVTKHSAACSQRSSIDPCQRVIEGRSGDTCGVCGGTTQVPCSACKGSGRLTKAGYHTRNPVDTRRIIGAALALQHRLATDCAQWREVAVICISTFLLHWASKHEFAPG